MTDVLEDSIGKEADFETTQPHHITVRGEEILLVYREHEWHAYSLRCPHKGAMMRVEDLKGDILACPFHAWYFDVSQNGRELHNYIDLTEYPVQVRDGELFIGVI